MNIFSKRKIYLDYASGALMHKDVASLMKKLLKRESYNPASIHSGGVSQNLVLENSRSIIAELIGSHKDEIIFTSSGTESVALAIIGTIMEARKTITMPHVVTSTIEHSAVLETIKMLENYSLINATYLEPESTGLVDLESLKKSINSNTVLVSLCLVNGEIGTILNTEDVLKILNKFKEETNGLKSIHLTNQPYYPYLHLDASQAAMHIDLSIWVKKNVDLISLNSVKLGGPAGIALLFKKRKLILSNMYAGGAQELGIRPGTQSPLLTAGFAKAFEITKNNLSQNKNKYIKLKQLFLQKISKLSKEFDFNFIENSNIYSVPSIVNISFPYFSGQQMAIELDARGVMVSSKSACKSNDENESYVVGQIRKKNNSDAYNKYGSIRVSFGPDTKNNDIIKLINALEEVLKTYKGVLY